MRKTSCMRKGAAVAAGVGASVLVLSAVVSALRKANEAKGSAQNIQEHANEQEFLGFAFVHPANYLRYLLGRLVAGNRRDDGKIGPLGGASA